MSLQRPTVAVLDFGGQYVHLIANRLRRLGVYSEIHSPQSSPESLAHVCGIIYSGGPSSVYAENAPAYNPKILELPVPKLGICYGHQLISQQLGGRVAPGAVKEYGIAQLEISDGSHPLLAGLPKQSPMWMSHGDHVDQLAPGFRVLATTKDCASAVVSCDIKKIYGIQFHPEVTHSCYGNQVLSNFLDLCACPRNWNMSSYLETINRQILQQAGTRNVFLLVSGGVDSTVAFVLLNRVLGHHRVLGLHIDNGLMRLGESKAVKEFLTQQGMNNLRVVDASGEFLNALQGVCEPEEKRRRIGRVFLEVKDKALAQLNLDPEQWIIAQGTIYPDTIESGGTSNADVIKTHHNRVQEVFDLMEKGLLLEPLADLYKDEVRLLGEELGIPGPLVWRHPFPGPGLGVRLLCSDGKFQGYMGAEIIGLHQFLAEHRLKGELLPLRSVGVQGDGRTYAQPIVLQGLLDWKTLEEKSTAITNRFAAINRVVWEAGCVKSAKYELVRQFCEKSALDSLRNFDEICTQFLHRHNLYKTIWQMPVVLPPLHAAGRPVVVVRPVDSSEAMTASFSEIPQELIVLLWNELCKAGAGALLYDITHKPPGTIEWE